MIVIGFIIIINATTTANFRWAYLQKSWRSLTSGTQNTIYKTGSLTESIELSSSLKAFLHVLNGCPLERLSLHSGDSNDYDRKAGLGDRNSTRAAGSTAMLAPPSYLSAPSSVSGMGLTPAQHAMSSLHPSHMVLNLSQYNSIHYPHQHQHAGQEGPPSSMTDYQQLQQYSHAATQYPQGASAGDLGAVIANPTYLYNQPPLKGILKSTDFRSDEFQPRPIAMQNQQYSEPGYYNPHQQVHNQPSGEGGRNSANSADAAWGGGSWGVPAPSNTQQSSYRPVPNSNRTVGGAGLPIAHYETHSSGAQMNNLAPHHSSAFASNAESDAIICADSFGGNSTLFSFIAGQSNLLAGSDSIGQGIDVGVSATSNDKVISDEAAAKIAGMTGATADDDGGGAGGRSLVPLRDSRQQQLQPKPKPKPAKDFGTFFRQQLQNIPASSSLSASICTTDARDNAGGVSLSAPATGEISEAGTRKTSGVAAAPFAAESVSKAAQDAVDTLVTAPAYPQIERPKGGFDSILGSPMGLSLPGLSGLSNMMELPPLQLTNSPAPLPKKGAQVALPGSEYVQSEGTKSAAAGPPSARASASTAAPVATDQAQYRDRDFKSKVNTSKRKNRGEDKGKSTGNNRGNSIGASDIGAAAHNGAEHSLFGFSKLDWEVTQSSRQQAPSSLFTDTSFLDRGGAEGRKGEEVPLLDNSTFMMHDFGEAHAEHSLAGIPPPVAATSVEQALVVPTDAVSTKLSLLGSSPLRHKNSRNGASNGRAAAASIGADREQHINRRDLPSVPEEYSQSNEEGDPSQQRTPAATATETPIVGAVRETARNGEPSIESGRSHWRHNDNSGIARPRGDSLSFLRGVSNLDSAGPLADSGAFLLDGFTALGSNFTAAGMNMLPSSGRQHSDSLRPKNAHSSAAINPDDAGAGAATTSSTGALAGSVESPLQGKDCADAATTSAFAADHRHLRTPASEDNDFASTTDPASSGSEPKSLQGPSSMTSGAGAGASGGAIAMGGAGAGARAEVAVDSKAARSVRPFADMAKRDGILQSIREGSMGSRSGSGSGSGSRMVRERNLKRPHTATAGFDGDRLTAKAPRTTNTVPGTGVCNGMPHAGDQGSGSESGGGGEQDRSVRQQPIRSLFSAVTSSVGGSLAPSVPPVSRVDLA